MRNRSLVVRRFSYLLAAATALRVGAATAILASSQPAAALTNAGFESGNFTGWSCSTVDSVVTGHAHSGTYALQGNANNSDTAQCSEQVTVTANTTYTLSAP